MKRLAMLRDHISSRKETEAELAADQHVPEQDRADQRCRRPPATTPRCWLR